MTNNLQGVGVRLEETSYQLGRTLTLDPKSERFIGAGVEKANAFLTRNYRSPFVGGFDLTCRRNLVYYTEGKAIGDYGSAKCGRDVCAFEYNLYWNAAGEPVVFGKRDLSQWQALGQDKNSLIADPLFVDAKKGDFRLRPRSPAARIGFEPWDFSAVGPRSDTSVK